MEAHVGNTVRASIDDGYNTMIIGVVEERVYDDGYLHRLREISTTGNPDMHRSPHDNCLWVWDFEIQEIIQANT